MERIIGTFHETIKLRIATSMESILIDPSHFSIACTFPAQLLSPNCDRIVATSIEYRDKSIEMGAFRLAHQQDRQGSVRVRGKGSLMSVFDYEFELESQTLRVKSSTHLVFSLLNVLKPKFVKNDKLDQLLNGDDIEEHGVISMDQTGRLLIENESCSFPALGIWVKTRELQTVKVYSLISHFLHSSHFKDKVLVQLRRQNYIYFVKMNGGEMPECYLLTWSLPHHTQIQETLYPIIPNTEITIYLGNPNLEFTLRAPDKKPITNPESQNGLLFSSPQKEMTNDEFIDQLEKLHLVESPQFSSIKKEKKGHDWESECYYLRGKASSQERQINSLKLEVARLHKELLFMRQNLTSPCQKPQICFQSPLEIEQSSQQRQRMKKLSESDLYVSGMKSLNSASTKEKKSFDESERKGSGHETCENENEASQEPWEKFELIEDQQL